MLRSQTRASFAAVLVAGALATVSLPASAVSVYVTSSGNAGADANLTTALQSFGHAVTVGASYLDLDGSQPIGNFDVVYLQVNYNWGSGSGQSPLAGQTALVNYVNGGGGLVTTEWLLWRIGTNPGSFFTALSPILPVAPTPSFDSLGLVTFAQVMADPVVNAGLPASFSTPLADIGGTRTHGNARAGATTYYSMNDGYAALAGWDRGSGRVLSFTTTNGAAQVGDPEFRRLLSNTLDFAAGERTPPPVSEPGLLVLLGAGLAALRLFRRRD